MDFKALVAIIIGSALINNFVLRQFLGICPFLGVSKEIKNSAGMGISVVFVMLLATAVTWPIQTFVLERFGLGYLQTLLFILIIATLVQFVEIAVKKFIPALYSALGVYLPLITTNCAILGVTIANIKNSYTFAQSMAHALGGGLGFLLAMVVFSGIREHTENTDPPPSFRGLPLTLISVSILSLAFFGFSGVSEGLFG
ncbi:MAG: RnfABCDGE type electron transport complex subunit A [Oscillospiraceae bacterium]|nr:RnfABCDGE type electron transport complex subunit A [Oscillospiraceae bacterium]